jgi:hypothetical protein
MTATCDTGKLRFQSEADALHTDGTGRMHAHRCEFCDGWHLTGHGRRFKARTIHKRSGRDESVRRVWEL